MLIALKRIVVTLLALALCLLCFPALAEEAALLFEDNFDGTVLDETKWGYATEYQRYPCCKWDKNMYKLDGQGNLILKAEYDAENQMARCGAIWTRGLWEGELGYYEARVKLPKTPGLWGAYWLMCGDVGNEFGGAKNGVEIDMIESIDGYKGEFNFAMHWDGYGDAHKQLGFDMTKKKVGIDIYDGEFHTFGVNRRANGYDFYIDGWLIWQPMLSEVDPCTLPGYMILSIECAEWAGFGSIEGSVEALPTEMVVDYVKVWDQCPYQAK